MSLYLKANIDNKNIDIYQDWMKKNNLKLTSFNYMCLYLV